MRSQPHVLAVLRRYTRFAAGITAAMGAAVLAGWAFDVPLLQSVRPGLATMKANVALCFLMAGTALWMLRDQPSVAAGSRPKTLGRLLALVILTIAAVSFGVSPGRIALSTALCLGLLAAALLLLDHAPRRGPVPAEVLSLLAGLISYVVLLVYTFRPLAIVPPGTDVGMAVHTAATLAVLTAGILAARPQRGWVALLASESPGGFLLRRFLPVVLLIPVPVSWLRLVGQRAGWFGREFGVGIPAAATAVFFFVLLIWTARSLNGLEEQRERAEAAVRQSREWLAAVFEGSRDGICVEEDERIVFANQALALLYGYASTAELAGQHVSSLHAAEDDERLREYGRMRREGKPAPATYEFKGSRQDGKQIMVEAAVSVTTIGGKRYIISAERDITERKAFEAQLRQSQKMEAVGQLAAGVAHDFNNLLGVILGHADLLAMDQQMEPRSAGRLEELKRAVERAAELTRQLLAFSRQQVIEPAVLDLNAVVADSQKLLDRLLPENIELRIALASEPVMVKADRMQIGQVLLNLAVNARDAMPSGGAVTMETGSVNLDEGYAKVHYPVTPGRYAMLAVTDAGVGMDAETQARIFEPFFTTKERGKGTGLGLATVYGIVKQNGGHIWVYSEPGRGSTFKVYLPQVDVPEQAAQPETRPEALAGNETVMVVEDSAPLRTVIRESLAASGYAVLEAGTGPEALEIADRHAGPLHLLVTDVVMPVMGGRELAERLRRKRPQTKVLYISGYPDDTIARQGVLEPGVAFLQKPFGPIELVRKVREELDAEHTA